jgi:Zn-dependent protease with chaperone function
LIIPFKLTFMLRTVDSLSILPDFKQTLIAFIIAAVAGALHWHFSVDGMVNRSLSGIGAKPADEKDTLHRMFMNVIEEASVACGGRKVEPWVIPVSALNAFALSDFSGRGVIGVTEGLLAKLRREQLEAVVGHEFGHIVSGDSKMTTVTAALFGVYSLLMDGIGKTLGSNNRMRFRSRSSGGMVLFLILVYAILAITKGMSMLLNLFLSRQREYRADAISFRLTRNPLALAEALQIISRGWRGAYLNSEYLSGIFIVNPVYRALDESEGIFSDLFSTHPPVQKRISVALDMAHVNLQNLSEHIRAQQQSAQQQRAASAVVDIVNPEEHWFAAGTDGAWQGPFALEQLTAMPWFNAETWIRKDTGTRVQYAWQDPALRAKLEPDRGPSGTYACPRCATPLREALYEGVPLWHCHGCEGNLLHREKIIRILARMQQGFSADVIQQAVMLKKTGAQNKSYSPLRDESFRSVYEFACPVCSRKMRRKFYNFDYLIEVDLCVNCDIIWFDKNELETLQLLFEEQEGAR